MRMACAGSMRSGGVVVGGRPAALATTVARRCAPARACAARATSRAECESEASSPRLDRFLAGAASLTSLATTGPDAAAMADEIAADVVATPEADVQAGDFAIVDGIILFAPLIIYGFWVIYSSATDKPKLSDFLTLVASTIVIGNLVSILVFKVRFF